jgi:hypothetical protein
VTLSDLPAGPEREAALWTFDSFVNDIASCRYEGAVAVLAQGASTTASTLQIPIEQVPLGARVPTKNPRRWEFDDSLAEPDQGSWAKVCFTVGVARGGQSTFSLAEYKDATSPAPSPHYSD